MGTVEHAPCCAQSRTERNTGIDDARRDPAAGRGPLKDDHRNGALILSVRQPKDASHQGGTLPATLRYSRENPPVKGDQRAGFLIPKHAPLDTAETPQHAFIKWRRRDDLSLDLSPTKSRQEDSIFSWRYRYGSTFSLPTSLRPAGFGSAPKLRSNAGGY
jgi:hypothetical protein